VRLTRPRGYFGWPRDVVLLDGREVAERREGIASIAVANLRLPGMRLAAPCRPCSTRRASWRVPCPCPRNRISIAEMTW
jgi:hypothetical protein